MPHQSMFSLPVILIFALIGCSASEEPESAKDQAELRQQVTQQQDSKPVLAGDCDLLSAAEIEAAFGGALTVRKVSGHGERGRGCTVSLVEGADSQLFYQIGDRAVFEMRRDSYSAQPKLSFEAIDIGAEAYLVNQAQVIAIDSSDRSINMGLQLIVFDGELPIDHASIAAGVQGLSSTALRRAGGG